MKKEITIDELIDTLNEFLEENPVIMSAIALTGYPDPDTIGVNSDEMIPDTEDWSYGYAYNMIGILNSVFMSIDEEEPPILIITDELGIITKFFLNPLAKEDSESKPKDRSKEVEKKTDIKIN